MHILKTKARAQCRYQCTDCGQLSSRLFTSRSLHRYLRRYLCTDITFCDQLSSHLSTPRTTGPYMGTYIRTYTWSASYRTTVTGTYRWVLYGHIHGSQLSSHLFTPIGPRVRGTYGYLHGYCTDIHSSIGSDHVNHMHTIPLSFNEYPRTIVLSNFKLNQNNSFTCMK